MSLAELETWSKKTGWNKYAVYKSAAEAFTAPNTVALKCFETTAQGATIGRAPVNIRPRTIQARL